MHCPNHTLIHLMHGSHDLILLVTPLTSTVKLPFEECPQTHLSKSSSALPWLDIMLSPLKAIEVCMTGGTGGSRGPGNGAPVCYLSGTW